MKRSRFIAGAVLVILSLITWNRATAQCADWRAGPLFEIAGTNFYVYALTTWDPDGAGPLTPQLVAGGLFTSAGGTEASAIARWDGSAWQPFGSGMGSTSFWPNVQALAVLPAGFGAFGGQLVAAGRFETAGGVTVNHIARWDGAAWHPIGTGANSSQTFGADIYSLIVVPPGAGALSGHLVAAGYFESIGGVAAKNIAHWDGSTWQPLGPGLGALASEYVDAVTVWDPDGPGPLPLQLVAGGEFITSGATNVNNIARWDGANWVGFGAGLSGGYSPPVYALSTIPAGNGPFAGQLVAGGEFLQSGGTTLNFVARWDGAAWQPFGTGLNDEITAFGQWDPDGAGPQSTQLVAGGDFWTIDGNPVSIGIMRWNGNAWQSIGDGFDGSNVLALTTFTPNGSTTAQLVAGGSFDRAGDNQVNHLAHFNNSNWVAFTESAVGAQLFAMAQLGARVVGAGNFLVSTTSGNSPHNIAAWDGMNIANLGTGTNGTIRALKTFNTGVGIAQTSHLVAGGEFSAAGGVAANRIAQWTENAVVGFPSPTWSAMGAGFNNTVRAIERFNNQIYAGGEFTASGDNATALAHIAVFNGTSWQPLGSGLSGTCFALKVYNGQLYAGGLFTLAGGLTSAGLARWNGSSWSAVGGISGTVRSLEVYDGDLVIGGFFSVVSGSPNIMKYNSVTNTYSALGPGGTDSTVFTVLNEGGFLYVGGFFTQAGGATHNHLARWNGSAWSDVSGGADDTVFAMIGFHNEVHAGGTFSTVRNGVIASPGWARFLETGIPWAALQPLGDTGACNEEVSFTAHSAVGYSVNYNWRHNGTILVDGPTGTGSFIAGSHNATLDVGHISAADAGTYDLVLSNSCGSATSIGATLTVSGGTGNGDGNGDGLVNGLDIPGFVSMATTGVSQGRGICAYDMNGDGVVNVLDLTPFIARLLAG